MIPDGQEEDWEDYDVDDDENDCKKQLDVLLPRTTHGLNWSKTPANLWRKLRVSEA